MNNSMKELAKIPELLYLSHIGSCGSQLFVIPCCRFTVWIVGELLQSRNMRASHELALPF